MSVPDGRAWMAWLLTECRAFCASDFANNQLAMARNIGLRELAITLQADLHRACPGEYLTMLRERGTNERDNRDGAAVSGDEGGSPAQSPTPAAAPTQTSTQGTATTPEPALTSSVLTADPAAPAAEPAKPAEPAPITPVEYTDFTLPDGVDKDAPALATFRDEASKLGISQDAAQAIVSKVGEQIAAQGRAQAEAWQGLNQTWQAEIKADPEFGGSKPARHRRQYRPRVR